MVASSLVDCTRTSSSSLASPTGFLLVVVPLMFVLMHIFMKMIINLNNYKKRRGMSREQYEIGQFERRSLRRGV